MTSHSHQHTVAVTGATGLIGSYIVRDLLNEGYHVRAVVESVAHPKDTEHLFKFKNAADRLVLHEAKLGDLTAFNEAFSGCYGVFHLASPVKFDQVSDPKKELIDPATQGTLSVLRAANNCGVRKVIFTSCMTAAAYNNYDERHVYSEDDWSDYDLMVSHKKWYHLSKYSAEKAAWSFMEKGDRTFDLITILPGMTIGPFMTRSLNASNARILSFIQGSISEIPNKGIFLTDARDVARAHILLFKEAEKQEREGIPLQRRMGSNRYLCVATCLKWKDICDKLRKMVPAENRDKIPSQMSSSPGYEPAAASSKNLEQLGFEFRPMDRTLEELIGYFKSQNLL
eukprot:gb/GECH01012673.1/.p1 GENE.gb/GECH01012673.1/~~gb/GECH01012673.1/.p1  ORF type:complete len:341 (+),score=56.72 gb/GECH01012673.1/:1-1023(+)